MQNNTFIHIGLPKTGTTFLQKCVFNNIEGVTLVYNNMIDIFKNSAVIISNESISGFMVWQPSDPKINILKERIFNIKNMFVNPKIIIGFREPASLVNSMFKQFLHEGGTCKFEQFYGDDPNTIVKPTDLILSQYYNLIIKEFGIDNVFCYEFDEIKSNKDKLIKDLSLFMNLKQDLKILYKGNSINQGVPDNIELLLIKLNSVANYLNSKFNINLHDKSLPLTPRKLCQNYLPNLLGRQTIRTLVEIENVFNEDYSKLKMNILKSREIFR